MPHYQYLAKRLFVILVGPNKNPIAVVPITFLVSGWFCEEGGCGKKGAVREFIKISNIQEEEHTEKGLLDILVVLLN